MSQLNIIRSPIKSVRKIRTADEEYVYDIGMRNEAKPWFFGNNILLHNSVYFSVHPIIKDEVERGELPFSAEKAIELYDNVGQQVNASFPEFMYRAFNCPETHGRIIAAGREIVASKALFIKKKRYAALVIDKEGKRKDKDGFGEVKAMGLDLRRSDTPDYMQTFLSEILLMTLTGRETKNILDRVVEFRTEFRNKEAWEKGTPKRINNLTHHTAVFQKTGKCGVGHALAAINWNRLRKAHGDTTSIEITDGMKAVVCKLKPNNMKMTSIAYPTDEKRLPYWFKELAFDDNLMEDTIIDKKIDNLLGVLKFDLKSTQRKNNFDSLFELS